MCSLYPSITETTDYVMVRPGANAEFFCVVDANPVGPDHVKWVRDGFDMAAKAVTTFSNVSRSLYLVSERHLVLLGPLSDGAISFQVVKNVSAADSGEFTCVANNNIGQEVKNTSFLLVRCESGDRLIP